MATRAIGPKLIVGTFIGIIIGAVAAIFGLIFAGALVLTGLYLLGRYRTEHARTEDFWRANAHRFTDPAERQRRWLDEQVKRNAYWLRFPLEQIPGETRMGRHLDRVFTPWSECDQGHFAFHRMGVLFNRDGADRVVRVCAESGCTCTWSELLIGGVE